ncbi:MAG: DUF5908 family protein [Tannerella sp.]|uniref:DUF5908 family protein n=1 Tax=Tannerella sp. TaxID=2382127 RepID=UPI003FA1C79D
MTVQINELVIRAKIDAQAQSERAKVIRSDESSSKRDKITIDNNIASWKNRRER